MGPDDCWLWCARAVDGWSYGRIQAPRAEEPKHLIGAHIAAYLLMVRPLPLGRATWGHSVASLTGLRLYTHRVDYDQAVELETRQRAVSRCGWASDRAA